MDSAALSESELLDMYPYELVGIDDHPLGSSVKLNGPPGAGKSTNLRGRAALQAIRDDLDLSEVAYITYRKSLASEILDDWLDLSSDLPEGVNLLDEYDVQNPTDGKTRHFGTAHAVSKRVLGDHYEMVQDKHKADFAQSVVGVPYHGDTQWEDTAGKLLFAVFAWLQDNRLPMDQAHECPQYDDLCESWHTSDVDISLLWSEWQDYKANPESRPTDDRQSDGELWDFSDLFEVVLANDVTLDVDLLIVDELHDAYPLMFAVIQQWIQDVQSRGGTVIVGGDPLQVVNEYQGASPRFFKNLDLPEIELPQSYRVPAEHWRLANRMISQSFAAPSLEPAHDGGVIEYRDVPTWSWDDNHSPAEYGTPDDLLSEQPSEYIRDRSRDGVLYLVRTRPQMAHISRVFRRQGIIFRGSGGSDGWSWDTAETRCSLYNALVKLSRFSADDWEYDWGTSYVGTGEDHTRTSLTGKEVFALVKHVPDSQIQNYENTYGWARTAKSNDESVPVLELAKRVTAEFWESFTERSESVDNLVVTDDLRRWLSPALERNGGLLDETERGLRDQLNLRLQTIHASKGSQAETVILYDGVSSRIHDNLMSRERELENEHRVWYVALTRAKERLVIAENAFGWTMPFVAPLTRGGSDD